LGNACAASPDIIMNRVVVYMLEKLRDLNGVFFYFF